MKFIRDEIEAAEASGMPDLWRTEFRTVGLRGLLREIENAGHGSWTPGDAPPPRDGSSDPARVCLVTCERKGIRFLTKAQYHFGQRRWFFDEPPSPGTKVVAWMDAPKPYDAPAVDPVAPGLN